MIAPMCSSPTVTVTRSTGSSSATFLPTTAASFNAAAAAIWNAMSEESTECALPSNRVTRTSTIGKPAMTPFSSWARDPFSTDGMKLRGTAPPTTLSTNSKPAPRSSGSTSMLTTAYWPWPPDCFTWRPTARALSVKVSRNAILTSSCSTLTP